MTRLRGAALLAVSVTVAALAFGSRPLGVAGIGLLLALGATRAWSGLVRGPVSVAQRVHPSPSSEGDVVRLVVEARRAARIPVGSILVRGRVGRLGGYECRLEGRGRTATGEATLGPLPRGRYPFSDVQLVLADHLGLTAVTRDVDERRVILVHPRLVELEALFSDAGRMGNDGRRLLLRRPVGFDFHSVREHEQGESLRRVHWPTTARRGRLMVKELEDPPRDAVAVLLDCDPAGAAGEPPGSSFDVAVRAAGSVLMAYLARGRRATLVTTGRERMVVPARGLDGEFRVALDALAAVQPDALHGFARLLGQETPVGQAGELVVVTAALDATVVARLLAAAAQRLVSVVWIDAPSFAGLATRVDTDVLRLTASGIPTAVIRSGDDLASALAAPTTRMAARA